MIMTGLDDILNDELELVLETPSITEPINEPIDDNGLFLEQETLPNSSNSILDTYLKSIGIEDSKIIMIDENNEEKQVDFYELNEEEQLEILRSASQQESQQDLDDSEIDLINHLRSNNLTWDQFLESYKTSIIEEFGNQPTQSYEIDAYDDQELFVLDLKQKYNLSEEELAKELEKELQDEVLFKKKIDVLRAEYKQLEDQYNTAQQEQFEKDRQEQYDQFADTMVNVALQTPEFYGIELEDDEKNEVLSFLLELDENGTSEFYKSLNDPKKLYEAAWFLRYGKESFDALKNAYESEITRLKKPDNPRVTTRQQQSTTVGSINDLNF